MIEYENLNNNKFDFNPNIAIQLLKEAGYQNRNDNGYLYHEETGKVLSFTVEVNKAVEYRITPMQQILKEYGIDMQIKFIDSTTRWKNIKNHSKSSPNVSNKRPQIDPGAPQGPA